MQQIFGAFFSDSVVAALLLIPRNVAFRSLIRWFVLFYHDVAHLCLHTSLYISLSERPRCEGSVGISTPVRDSRRGRRLERRFRPLVVEEPDVERTLEILKVFADNYAAYHGVRYTDNALVAAAKLADRYVTDRCLPDKAIDLIDEAGSTVTMNAVEVEEDDDETEPEPEFVTEDDVAEVVSDMTGIPAGRLDTGEKARLSMLESVVGLRV